MNQNPRQTLTLFVCVGFSMYVFGFSMLQMRQFCLFTYPPSSKWVSSKKMIFFCQNLYLLTVGWSIGFKSWTTWPCMSSYQGLYAKFISIMSPKCSIVENDVELMLMALYAHFLPQQQFSRLFALFLAFHALVYRWGRQFLSLFSLANEHTELMVFLFFQNLLYKKFFLNNNH